MIFLKIENMKINSFGKLKDKEIELSNGVNLIYGNNEAGKSTLLKFIHNTFYGTSKNKKGKSFSDYDLYKPWNTEEFSGKIDYRLDSGEKFEVYREFGKKNPKLYNEDLEDVLKDYSINKNSGSEFFFEQTKVDEFMFLSSIVSMQKEVKLNTQDQNIYIQKIANLASTGDDSVSFKKAMDKLNKKQVDEIGTDRTQGKPINIVKSNINKYEKQIEELSRFKQNKLEIEERENALQKEIQKNKYKSNFIKELQEINQKERIEKEKIKLNQEIIEKNNNQINELENDVDKLIQEQENNEAKKIDIKKVNYGIYIGIILILAILAIIAFVFTKNIILLVSCAILAVGVGITCFLNKNKVDTKIRKEQSLKNEIKNKLNEKIAILDNQLDVLKKNNEDINKQIEEIKEEMLNKSAIKKDELKAKYFYQINISELNNLLALEETSRELNK